MFILRKLDEIVELTEEAAQSCIKTDKTDFNAIAGNPRLRLMQRQGGAA